MFKHILLAIDGTDVSLRAAKVGIDLAKACGASTYALHVTAPYLALALIGEVFAANELIYERKSVEQAERYLGEVRALAKDAGVACESHYVCDEYPYQAIVRAAENAHCDLIVMGTYGKRGVTRLLLGSETHKTILEAKVPVLVCK